MSPRYKIVVLVNHLSCVVFSVPNEAAEAVANLLTEEGSGAELRDTEISPAAAAGVTECVVWMPPSDVERRVHQVEILLGSLKELGVNTAPWSWRAEETDPQSWQDAYKRFFSKIRIGRRFVIKPSWENVEPLPQHLVIEMDPGMAFGTGLHPSTQMMMHILERIARFGPPPSTLLDIGCGTGILAIAAAKLWQNCKILAIDNDESAVQICQENVKRNHLQNKIMVEHRSAAEVDKRYSLVLANLNLDTLTELQPKMRNYVNDTGYLALSGLLAEQAVSICRQYTRDLTFEPEFSEEMEEWRALLLKART